MKAAHLAHGPSSFSATAAATILTTVALPSLDGSCLLLVSPLPKPLAPSPLRPDIVDRFVTFLTDDGLLKLAQDTGSLSAGSIELATTIWRINRACTDPNTNKEQPTSAKIRAEMCNHYLAASRSSSSSPSSSSSSSSSS